MRTIWKWELQSEITISMPVGAEALSVQTQGETICLWALVKPDAKTEDRRFVVHGTGHVVADEGLEYIGTALLYEGRLVMHVFEELTRTEEERASPA